MTNTSEWLASVIADRLASLALAEEAFTIADLVISTDQKYDGVALRLRDGRQFRVVVIETT